MLTTLAERIRERLNALGMSDAELARQAKVKPPSVFLWLDGSTKSIKGDNLLRAAAALKVTPEWLAYGIGRKLLDEPAAAPPASNEPATYYGDATIVEAVKLLESMNSAARVEALSFLKVFASKKGVQTAHGADTSLPAAKRAA